MDVGPQAPSGVGLWHLCIAITQIDPLPGKDENKPFRFGPTTLGKLNERNDKGTESAVHWIPLPNVDD